MFYVTRHHGRHDPVRKDRLAMKTLCAVSITHFSTPLHDCQKYYLTFPYAKHIAPSRSLGVYIVDIMYVVR
jgi:hypothetical protein